MGERAIYCYVCRRCSKVVEVVHTPAYYVDDRYLINVSPLMQLARWVPQWALDRILKYQMSE
jgi:hypothetical protein